MSYRSATGTRVVITHGTDTMIETAKYVLASGAAAGKTVAFTGMPAKASTKSKSARLPV